LSKSWPRKTSRWWLLLIASLAALALAAGCDTQPAGPPSQARVAQVVDGDTLVLEGGLKVRVLGIDAPEMEKQGQPAEFLAHKSRAALKEMTLGQTVRLEYDRQRYDHYGRVLAFLFLSDNTFINAELVRQGLARVYFHQPNTRHREDLLAAQREAIEAKRGIWLKLLNQDEEYYPGNRSTLRLHRPGCPLGAKMAPANRVDFRSLKEAYLQGYSPCRSCRP
jgi:micrococcal nuclease